MTEPQLNGAGWSLAQALDGASRRAKPKASLSRHLVGHRVAMAETAPSTETPDAVHAPEDAALVARSAQAERSSIC